MRLSLLRQHREMHAEAGEVGSPIVQAGTVRRRWEFGEELGL